MLNLENQLKEVVNTVLVSTDLSVTGCDKVLRDAVSKTMAMATKFERPPYFKPSDMSAESFKQLHALYSDMRVAYFNNKQDIFKFVELTREVSFSASDDLSILNEKFRLLIQLVEDETLNWKTYMRRMFKRDSKWVTRFNKIMDSAKCEGVDE